MPWPIKVSLGGSGDGRGIGEITTMGDFLFNKEGVAGDGNRTRVNPLPKGCPPEGAPALDIFLDEGEYNQKEIIVKRRFLTNFSCFEGDILVG